MIKTIAPLAFANKIEIKPEDPHFNVVAWVGQETDAKAMAEAHYRQAILTGKAEYKIAFFDATHRAREIENAISDYFAA